MLLEFCGMTRSMKRINIIFLLCFTVFVAVGQDVNDNIIKGDEAMKNLDYISAKIYYEDVVFTYCDMYAIKQLTAIWLADETIRTSMINVMKVCFNCLENNAGKLRDTTSIQMLITYYTQGIGIKKNETMAESWRQRLDDIQNPYIATNGQYGIRPSRKKEKTQFFAGYSASFYAPVGLTVGGIGRSVGWYLRFRSNLSFQDYTAVCDKAGIILEGLDNGFHETTKDKKANTYIGTGGIMVKAAPSFFISAGAGYCSRDVLYKFKKIGATETEAEGEFWAKCDDKTTSISGVALDLDGSFGISKKCYGSIGFSVLNFKYLSANAGIGIFF